MNFNLAKQYIAMAVAQREAARALAYSAPAVAANCRRQMRTNAKRAVDFLRVNQSSALVR